MNCSVSNYHTGVSDGICIYPQPGDESFASARLMVMCDSEEMLNSLVEQLYPYVSGDKQITATAFNEALDEALHADGNRKSCQLALLAFHKGGCLAAQMGNSRIMQVRCDAEEASSVEYDSRDQVLDIYSSKAKVELINDLKAGDRFAMFASEKLIPSKAARIMCSPTGGDEPQRLAKLSQMQAEAGNSNCVVMCHIDEVSGINPLANIKDLNPRWFILALVLLVAIAIGAIFSLNGGLFATSDQAAVTDSTQMDSLQNSQDSIVPTNANVDSSAPLRADTLKSFREKAIVPQDTMSIKEVHSNTTDETEQHEHKASEPSSEPAPTEPAVTETPSGD